MKTSCYYCSKEFENNEFRIHISSGEPCHFVCHLLFTSDDPEMMVLAIHNKWCTKAEFLAIKMKLL